jgi:hypothetical protein
MPMYLNKMMYDNAIGLLLHSEVHNHLTDYFKCQKSV